MTDFISLHFHNYQQILSIPRKWSHLVSGDFQKKKKSADSATRALNCTQTADHPLFWPCPIPSTQVVLSSAVSGIKRHRPHPPKAPLLCAFFGLRGMHYQGLHRNHRYPSHIRAFDWRCCTSQAGAFAKDGAPNEAQRRRAFGGCGWWCLIPDIAEDRMTWVEGIGQGQ